MSERMHLHIPPDDAPARDAATPLQPVPTTKDDLLIAALRHSNNVHDLLNAIASELDRVLGEQLDDPRCSALSALLRRRFLEQSGLFLFIAADNLGIELPADLRSDEGDAP